MTVRFFGGWDFTAEDADTRHARRPPATPKGVPMGGDLRRRRQARRRPSSSPRMKDPIGGNLDRIQIVKGWLDADGETQEKVYDVVWRDDRKPGADGKLPPVGNTVDVANATWTNTIGDPELITVWTDPDFDPALAAFYYARVIEIPTPRWTAYDAMRFGVKMPRGGADDHPGARLYLADLVRPAELNGITTRRRREDIPVRSAHAPRPSRPVQKGPHHATPRP